MKARKRVSVLVAMLVIIPAGFFAGCACAGSLRPIASPETLTAAPQVEGSWLSKDEGDTAQTVTVTSTGEKSYQLRWKEEDKDVEVVFDLSLVQIEGKLFFDAAFNRVQTKKGSETLYDLGVVPIHFVGRIWVEGKSMHARLLKYEWLQKKVQEGQVKLTYLEHHSKDEDLILFTAGAEDVRAFLRQYADDQEAFAENMNFERVTAPGDSTVVKP